jgi:hypothetical protein
MIMCFFTFVQPLFDIIHYKIQVPHQRHFSSCFLSMLLGLHKIVVNLQKKSFGNFDNF